MNSSQPVWLEVALNGAAGQGLQPGIPIRPEAIIQEAVACARAGAVIIHLHAFDENGRGVEDADIYTRIIESIKEQCDVIVYPTLALQGDVESRFAPIRELSARGLMEWGVIDPGSVNITHQSQAAGRVDGIHYVNPDSHIRAGLELAEQQGWRPAYAIYEPGFARLGAALADLYPNIKTPVYRLMFSDHLLFGMPPREAGLQFYAQHLADTAPGAQWMVSGLDADIDAIMPAAISMGAHIRVGLEDAPLGTTKTNLQLVEQAVETIEACGRRLATVSEVRAAD